MAAVRGNNQYTHISANTTGVQVGPVGTITLHTVSINTKGATSNLLTIYDGTSTSGTVVAAYDTTAQVASVNLDVTLQVGMFVVLAAGTAADITLSWAPGNG
jgi:hypothetical protein